MSFNRCYAPGQLPINPAAVAVFAETLVFKTPVVSPCTSMVPCVILGKSLSHSSIKMENPLQGYWKDLMQCLYENPKTFKWQTFLEQTVGTNSTKKKNCLTTGTQINYELFYYYPKPSSGKVLLLIVRPYICHLLRTYGAIVIGTAD